MPGNSGARKRPKKEKLPIYVLDTNILVDYPDVIPLPDGHSVELRDSTIDLSTAYIVIPTAVVRELSSFKNEISHRGRTARIALRRLREIFEGEIDTIDNVYCLKQSAWKKVGEQHFAVLPVHKDFKGALPYCPSEDDMDGQIILATMSAAFSVKGLPVDGTIEKESVLAFSSEDVVLLTNDNGLAIRARERGIKTSRYGYKLPEPYTGRRDIEVPTKLLNKFLQDGGLSRAEFERMLPGEPELVANEFIVMKADDPCAYHGYDESEFKMFFSNVGRYDYAMDAILPLEHIRNFPVRPRNPGQAIYAEALMNPDFAAVICTGPAGCGKTFMATVYGYNACKNGEFIGVTVVPCENQSKIGALPGDLNEEMDPEVQPLKNALRNYLIKEDSTIRKRLDALKKYGTNAKPKRGTDAEDSGTPNKRSSIKSEVNDRVNLIWENWFSSIPIENARGRDFALELALYDEFQDQNASQADTLIKRLGTDGKIIITGDVEQIHAPYLDSSNNGLVYASRLLRNNPMVAQVCFREDEVVRHPLVKVVAERQKMGPKEEP